MRAGEAELARQVAQLLREKPSLALGLLFGQTVMLYRTVLRLRPCPSHFS